MEPCKVADASMDVICSKKLPVDRITSVFVHHVDQYESPESIAKGHMRGIEVFEFLPKLECKVLPYHTTLFGVWER